MAVNYRRRAGCNSREARLRSSIAAYAGDDLLLIFKVKSKNSSGEVLSENDFKVKDSDYIAVYDKKLLWRANLYIDKPDKDLENADWNNVHPWTGEEGYGTNEWNKTYDGSQTKDKLSELDAGDGGQVVSYSRFEGYTLLRSKVGDLAETDSVSYDYNYGAIDAWDSPFDFVWKMVKQKEALVSHFKTKIKTSEECRKMGVFPATGTTEIAGNGVTNKSLSEWPYMMAPDGRWKFYWKASENGSQPFIPGLGFWKEFKNITCTEETQEIMNAITFPAGLSCGADCIGFAERAAKYEGSPYKWTKNSMMTKDRAEGNENPDSVKRSEHPLAFPFNSGTGASYEIVTWKDVNNSSDLRKLVYYTSVQSTTPGPSSSELERIKQLFLQVKPGDVITYAHETATTGTDTGTRSGAHIGIVRSTDYDTIIKAQTIHDIFSGIEVIESVYNQKLFNVFSRKMTEGPKNNSKVLENKENKSNSWYVSTTITQNDLTTYYRRWSIQRLGGK